MFETPRTSVPTIVVRAFVFRMVGQMIMEMLRRILNNRRSMMRFMLIDRYENRFGVMVHATAGMGAG